MNRTLLRTLQIGIALIVLTYVTVAIGVIIGAVAREEAIRIGLNVTTVIGLCMAAGIALLLLFGLGRNADREP